LNVAIATLFPYEPVPNLSAVPVISLGHRLSPMPGDNFLPLWHVSRRAEKLVRLSYAIRDFRPDVIHAHDPLGQLDSFFLQYLRPRRIPLCYTVHWIRSLDGWRARLQAARHRRADALFVHSADGARLLREEGVEPRRIWEIPHGNFLHLCGAPVTRSQARLRLSLPAQAQVLLFFGVIEPRKGLDVLLDAFGLLAPAFPNLHLVVAGPAREPLDGYRTQIERLGLSGRVVLAARYIPFDEIPMYFGASDVVVLPYRRIIQSGVLQFAYGFGLPVVVSNVGGIAEVVREDGTGNVASSLQPEELARAIDDLLKQPELRVSMGQRGRLLAETKYSWSAVARRIADVYRSLVVRHGSEDRAQFPETVS
jgi:glycosyltransferase involved in cell wall biosynthesis